MSVLVVVSVTAFRRIIQDVELCPWLNVIMIPITITFMYHYNCVLQSQAIAFNVMNVIV